MLFTFLFWGGQATRKGYGVVPQRSCINLAIHKLFAGSKKRGNKWLWLTCPVAVPSEDFVGWTWGHVVGGARHGRAGRRRWSQGRDRGDTGVVVVGRERLARPRAAPDAHRRTREGPRVHAVAGRRRRGSSPASAVEHLGHFGGAEVGGHRRAIHGQRKGRWVLTNMPLWSLQTPTHNRAVLNK